MSTLDVTAEEIVMEEDKVLCRLMPAVSNSKFKAIEITESDTLIALGRKPEFRENCIFNDGRISTTHCEVSLEKGSSDDKSFIIKVTDKSTNGRFQMSSRSVYHDDFQVVL